MGLRRDSANAWYDAQVAAGKTPAEIKAYLAKLDVWDRYDFDGDGDFNEPDGYIDHFQAVHAGGGEEAGAGEDAIWSHRWYVNPTDEGVTGPAVGGQNNLLGGTQIGDSGVWIGDYTVEPENGGLGVFAHEFGHDLGLPGLLRHRGRRERHRLLDADVVRFLAQRGRRPRATPSARPPAGSGRRRSSSSAGSTTPRSSKGESGPVHPEPVASRPTTNADQAVKVNLPNSTRTDQYVTPTEGAHSWWSGRGDDLKNTLTRTLTLAAGQSVTVSADLWYAIEESYDFLYAEYSTDGGAHWTTARQADHR